MGADHITFSVRDISTDRDCHFHLKCGAWDGNRTRTLNEREILSLLCLPISPPRPRTAVILTAKAKEGKRFRFPSFCLERQKSLELSTSTLARLRSTN